MESLNQRLQCSYSNAIHLYFVDIIEDLYSPRTASMDFVSELVRKRGKENLQKFIQFIVGIFNRYVSRSDVKVDTASMNYDAIHNTV